MVNKIQNNKYGEIEIFEDVSGLGFDIKVNGKSIGVYIGDPENEYEVTDYVASIVDIPKTTDEKRIEAGIQKLQIDELVISENIDS
jgi:hypothetical protein